MTKYKVIIYWSEEDQTYIAEVPELAGCKADGSSYQEAVSNAERVIAEWIETAIEQGWYIPEPKGRRLFTHCCAIARKHPLVVVICIMLVVFSFYFANFHHGFSYTKGDWGTFGDYVGGILNPVIAAFAFYLIAETYKLQIKAYDLQKTELEETRKLLKVSTDAQNDQVKLAALTALLNLNLTNISHIHSESSELWNEMKGSKKENEEIAEVVRGLYTESGRLVDENNKFKDQIEFFLSKETE
ncbi:MAG: type II toxin-antitoxin system HicB family antitoxin [Methylobacter sp.]|jgi:predicted RNase H-like HicB family nuclease/uncharacterized membrane protein|nr:type II toxin-antitoxin system HicB family antitoxin [Methylobacter sp.]